MIQCEREQVSDSHVSERLTARASDGWRLVSAVAHPFNTEEASPIWVLFWERVS